MKGYLPLVTTEGTRLVLKISAIDTLEELSPGFDLAGDPLPERTRIKAAGDFYVVRESIERIIDEATKPPEEVVVT
jgi:hypothetical protein